MTNWDLIGGNPAPGRPTEIRQLARRLDLAATEADAATSALEDIGLDLPESGWQGKTAEAFIDVFGELAPELRKLVHAYEGVGGALSRYADRVEDLQQSAMQAAARATAAEAAHRTSESAVAAATSALRSYRSQYEAATRRAEQARDQAVELSASGNPAAEVAWDHYHDVRQDAGRLGDQVHQATGQIAAAESAVEQAGRSLRRSCDDADDIADAFRRAAATAGREIQDALPDGWANRSNLEKVLSTAGDVLGGVGQFLLYTSPIGLGLLVADALIEAGGDIAAAMDALGITALDVIHALRDALGVIDTVLSFVMPALMIATFFFPALIPFTIAMAAIALTVAAARMATGVVAMSMYAMNGTPEDQREVGWGGLAWDALGVAGAYAGLRGATGLADDIARHGTGAAGWWRSFREPYVDTWNTVFTAPATNLHPLPRSGEQITRFLFSPVAEPARTFPRVERIFNGIGQVRDDAGIVIELIDVWRGRAAGPMPTNPVAIDYLQQQTRVHRNGEGTLMCVPLAPVPVRP